MPILRYTCIFLFLLCPYPTSLSDAPICCRIAVFWICGMHYLNSTSLMVVVATYNFLWTVFPRLWCDEGKGQRRNKKIWVYLKINIWGVFWYFIIFVVYVLGIYYFLVIFLASKIISLLVSYLFVSLMF